ncbi:MAG: hypothetical protein KatS3mg122_1823 [Caldimonas sp.]|uniref:hypothetical protein n=1 Tax=Caldimonas taiwanensis TaxID=307483 RepID=UPI00078112D0|nr:hypothetical protein [Caldimonas taiwanensis]GIX24592.1 MAG: hypothetical protein KatS3mg122_1823 [Caldimonas sp.]
MAAAFLVAAGATASNSQKAPADEGIEPTTFALNLPDVRWVVITENAQRIAPDVDTDLRCDRFAVTQREIATFLRRAQAVSAQDAMHVLNWTPCRASGRVGFVDGRTGHWSVNLSRKGWLRMDDGQEIHMVCPECRLAGQRLP